MTNFHIEDPMSLSVLLIDDNAGDCALIREAAKIVDHDVALDTVNDGEAALILAEESFESANTSIDMILLDVNMPGMSGLEVLKAIRSINHEIIIIMLTSSTYSNDITSAYENNADSYLIKSFEFNEYCNNLHNIFRFYKTVIQNRRQAKRIHTSVA